VKLVEIIEDIDGWRRRSRVGDPALVTILAPIIRLLKIAARRSRPRARTADAEPALISSAGAYIDGTPPFDTSSKRRTEFQRDSDRS
jgi:hypothetical protein